MFKNVRCCCFPKQNERIWFTQIDNMSLVSPLQFCSVRVGWKQKSTNPRNYVKATRAVCKHVSWVANDVNNVSLFFFIDPRNVKSTQMRFVLFFSTANVKVG